MLVRSVTRRRKPRRGSGAFLYMRKLRYLTGTFTTFSPFFLLPPMNTRQARQDKRNQKIVAVLDAHATEVATIPAVADAAAELRQQLKLVQPALDQQMAACQGKGATATKNALEAPLIGQLVKTAAALNLYYKKMMRLDLAQALHLRRSEYEKLGQPALVAEAQHVADQLKEHLADLTAYGFKTGADTDLRKQVESYAASIPGNRTAGGTGKVGTGTVRATFKNLDDYVDGDFRSAIELLVDEHPTLYKLLREAMRIDDTGGGKKGQGGSTPPQP